MTGRAKLPPLFDNDKALDPLSFTFKLMTLIMDLGMVLSDILSNLCLVPREQYDVDCTGKAI